MHQQDTQAKSVEEVAEETVEAVAKAAERRPWLSITAISGVIFGLVGFYDPIKDVYKQLTDSVYKDVVSVKLADYQKELWLKNSECLGALVMQETLLNDDVSIRAGVCPNKDVLIQVFPKNSPAVSNWITASRLSQQKTAGLFQAVAATLAPAPKELAHGTAIPAQARISTVCQGWADPERQSKLIRVVDENGKCFKEITNVYSGRVEYREAVSCTAKCR